MGSNFTNEGTNIISRSNLYILRKKKIKDEIEAAIRLLKRKIEPLEVADKFIHETFELMKDGISNRYPELTEKEIEQKIIDTLSFKEKIKSFRKRDRING